MDWCAWEDALLSHETKLQSLYGGRRDPAQAAFVRTCAHYFSHGLFLEDGALIRDAGRLAGIPGVLVHGRLDMKGPLEAAWELSRAWPGSQWLVAEDAGHLDSETKVGYVYEAVDRFAGRCRRVFPDDEGPLARPGMRTGPGRRRGDALAGYDLVPGADQQ